MNIISPLIIIFLFYFFCRIRLFRIILTNYNYENGDQANNSSFYGEYLCIKTTHTYIYMYMPEYNNVSMELKICNTIVLEQRNFLKYALLNEIVLYLIWFQKQLILPKKKT